MGQTVHAILAVASCVQAGVKLGIDMKKKDVFHISVRTKSMNALSQFV
jgi:hypothetical protein